MLFLSHLAKHVIYSQSTTALDAWYPLSCIFSFTGTDSSMLSKLHSTHGTKTIYRKPKSDQAAIFGIQHFAGTVHYKVDGFLEKNRDSVNTNLKELITLSTNKFFLNLFASDNLIGSDASAKKSMTLSLQFRTSLDSLMKTLSACHPFFIRCIKPNEDKKPNVNILNAGV